MKIDWYIFRIRINSVQVPKHESNTKSIKQDDMKISHYNLAFAKKKKKRIMDKCAHFALNI